MFYGFANEKKRGLLEKERTKYKPWQGGTYGGSLVFEANGKRYLVERIFGEKEREDFTRLKVIKKQMNEKRKVK